MTARPETVLRTIAELATHLRSTWATYEATEAALGAPTMRSNGLDGPSRGETTDPVYAAAISHTRYHTCTQRLDQALEHIRAAARTIDQVRRLQPELAREHAAAVKAARCSGLVDPTCTRNAVRTGLCWSCYRTSENRRSQA